MTGAISASKPEINNRFYDELGERWYEDDGHAIALLRAESAIKLDYVAKVLGSNAPAKGRLLDIGCGAGLVTIPLSQLGYDTLGIDLSESSLGVARSHARQVPGASFRVGDALDLPFEAESFDAVLLLDFLEHVAAPYEALSEATRVLKPGGVLIAHTFNRTLASYLLAVKALEIFIKDCPPHLHLHSHFIKPSELKTNIERLGLCWREWVGVRPRFFSRAFFKSLFTRRVDPSFAFAYSRSLAVGYMGYALKPKP